MPSRPSKVRTIAIHTEYITLGQLLKLADLVGSGSEVKDVLAEGGFMVNNEWDNRRGRKLYPDDIVQLPDGSKIHIKAKP